MTDNEQSKDIEPGWRGLSWLFFWYRYKWAHDLLGHQRHQMIHDPRTTVCNCGMRWSK